MDAFIATTRRPLPHVPILLFLLILAASTTAATADCNTQVYDKDEPPSLLCNLDINVTRNSDCSLAITERRLFPYMTKAKYIIIVRKIPKFQNVSDVKLLLKDTSLDTEDKVDDDEVAICFDTEKSEDPVNVVLTYKLSNGVMKFTDTCDREGESDNSLNVIRWSARRLNHSYDVVNVRFTTTEEKGKLAPLFGAKPTSQKEKEIVFKKEGAEIYQEVTYFVSESGTEVCPEDLGCFTKSLSVVAITIVVILVVIGLVVILLFCCGGESRRPRNTSTSETPNDGNNSST